MTRDLNHGQSTFSVVATTKTGTTNGLTYRYSVARALEVTI